MILRASVVALAALLSGCIIFDQKSEAVVFHQLAAPAPEIAARDADGPPVFIPRAIIPAALRRPNVVLLDDAGRVNIEDAHRWIAPLDRAVPETVARRLRRRAGIITATQTPSEDHLVLLLTVDKMDITAPAIAERRFFSLPGGTARPSAASLQLTCRLEKADGTPVSVKTFACSRPLGERAPVEFVQAQSANLAELTDEIARWLPAPPPSSK